MISSTLLLLAASVWSAAPAGSITPDVLRAHTRFLSSDLLEGRLPATRGDQLAQSYIASQFEALGLKPAGTDGTFFQPFDLVGVSGQPDKLHFTAGTKSLDLDFSKDFIAVSGHQAPVSTINNAEVVFVGYGIVAPEYKWDDYKGADLKGKVLLMMNSDPESDPALFAGKARLWYGRWDYKYEIAAKTGAVGAIILHTTPSAGYPWQVVQTSWTGEQFDLPTEPGRPALQVRAWTTEAATRALLGLAGKDLDKLTAAAQSRDFHPVPLGVSLSTEFKNGVLKKKTANVLGILPGSDPSLAKELVVYSAHHDHLGRKPGKAGEDEIYNGAVDNASGVAAMLAVARAFTALPRPPRRSVLFAAVAAEEQGLLGSQYLVEHPPVPVGKMAININIDGVNIWGRTKDVTVIGLGKSNVDQQIERAAAAQGRVVKPDQLSDRGFFYRSDQFNFAKWGVPSAYFGSGMDFIGRPDGWGKQQREQWEQTHYHQVNDELDPSWNLAGAIEDCNLYFQLGLQVSNALQSPRWNKGDEFEGARFKAQAALRSPRLKKN